MWQSPVGKGEWYMNRGLVNRDVTGHPKKKEAAETGV